ncbi:uncharacterized protein HGUI_00483 [Hanseniaspora guilliermondii]|uniref:tRNA (guanine(9)-N1)-methyltransferase n=1 Tax=Hanseniaspora guilliermondii TaxID=56406 RepID=A0A1L0B013_9ASCO|nr:uncharacterized protein HGUI_00483 [Hanseniaspora guilliermondii]
MSPDNNHAVDESILPLDDKFVQKCTNMNADIDEQVEGLLELSKMPFFSKLTEDSRIRYIKEYKIKQALKCFSEGKKPTDISERQWKHVLKLRFQELTRDAYKEYNLLKKKKQKERKKELKKNIEKTVPKTSQNEPRVSNNIKLIVDCSFDDLMLPKEVKSMSTQITRIYNCNKLSSHPFEEILVTSFNKRLRARFENEIDSYKKWSPLGNLKFVDEDILEDGKDMILENYVYLSADATDELEDFEKDKTYIIGGIVDKGRYKRLCYEKANKLGIKTAKLPIEKYIKMHGNKVLTSLHVVQLMNEYLQNGKNWELAFDTVMPRRKVIE